MYSIAIGGGADTTATGEILAYNGTNAVWLVDKSGKHERLGKDGTWYMPEYITIPNDNGNIKRLRANHQTKTVEICVDDIVNIFETETHFIFTLSTMTGTTTFNMVTKNEDTPDYHMIVYRRPSDWKKAQKMANDIEKLTEHVKTLMIGNGLLPMDYCGAFP